MPRMHAARDQVIARSLGRRPRHKRRLNLRGILLDKIVPDRHRHAAAQREVLLCISTAAQVEIAPLQPNLFVADRVFRRREWRRLRLDSSSSNSSGDHLDGAGQHVRVLKAAPRSRTCPFTATTYSDRARPPCHALVATFSSTTTCEMPLRSRRSRKISPPWSRRRFTQPIRTTWLPRVFRAKLSTHPRPLQTTQKV